ncbi:MAG: catalase family protein [Chloroflexota bacterium]|nr:catalase family protein [Chloroflexota bacterium]
MSETLFGFARIVRRQTGIRATFDLTLERPMRGIVQWLKNLFRPNMHLAIAEELRSSDEDSTTQEIIDVFTRNLHRRYITRRYERGANAKTYGVVRAEFQVLPGLPDALAKGVFREPRTYRAWIRVADTGSVLTPDPEHVGVVGMGIKLMSVPGPKLLADEIHTQDFTLIGVRSFTARDTAGMARLQTSILNYRPAFYFFNPLYPGRILDFIMQALDSRLLGSPLECQLFSCTAFLHGTGQAVHYSVRPTSQRRTPIPEFPSDNYLREAMIRTLRREDVYFDFMVQLQKDPHRQPIEDASIEWKESETPFVPVAKIRIPKQEFSTLAQLQFADSLTFTPWHCLAEHRPLGEINRSRKALYQETARLRQQMNGARHYEPTGDETFG